ncbi:MAG: sugar ABC transporter substrate-binding protein [Lachnospiraceae bacterium]|nr:sugar ABC transporter substrate-binding protein [Lachnospiraceae bacterium]
MGKRVLSALLVVLLLAAMAVTSLDQTRNISSEQPSGDASDPEASSVDASKDELILWYADGAMTEFLEAASLAYQAESGRHIRLENVSGVDYLEQINTASVYDGQEGPDGSKYEAPDLYLTSHDTLMRAYLAGLAMPITDPHEAVIPANFPETAIRAVTCDEKRVGYPLYYETNFFLYNKTYMQDIASAKVEEISDRAQGEAAQEAIDSGETNPEEEKDTATEDKAENKDTQKKDDRDKDGNGDDADAGKMDESDTQDGNEDPDGEETADGAGYAEEGEEGDPMGDEDVQASPEVLKQLSTMIPSTMDDIKNFANNYEAPEAVEAVFKWDVSDIFYNYFFVGNYMNVGGENGDNNAIFNIYNRQAVECLQIYQDLNSFFSIDAKEVSYDKILNEFLDGKTVFTVATTDAVPKIEDAKREGRFDFDYGISVLPNPSQTLRAGGLSMTTCIAVNGYSSQKDAANDFASYLTMEKGQELYRLAGHIASKRGCIYENNEIYNIMNEYERSVPLPKMMETSNFWVQLEIAMSKIWNGADPDETLKELSETMGEQIDEIDYHIPVQETIGAGAGAMFLTK